jgi:hypothetical protein
MFFVGWFDPGGIATVLYVLLVVSMLGVIVLTVLLSVYLHGMSAVPRSNRYNNATGRRHGHPVGFTIRNNGRQSAITSGHGVYSNTGTYHRR